MADDGADASETDPQARTGDGADGEQLLGEYPEGVGPEVFRERLVQLAAQDPAHGAHLELDVGYVSVEDIESVEAEEGGHRSRINLRNGVIVGGLTGAAIVAALATIRYRQRRSR